MIHDGNIKNRKRSTTKKSASNTIQRNIKEKFDYRDKPFDDFRLMIVEPPQKLNIEESKKF